MKSTGLLTHGLLAAMFLGMLAGCSGESPQQTSPAGQPAQKLPDFTGLVQQATPSVVKIKVSSHKSSQRQHESQDNRRLGEGRLRHWLEQFFGDNDGRQPAHHRVRTQVRPSTGTGFVISEDGYIITTRNIVHGADRIVVQLDNRRRMTAKLVGADKYSGIALLKVDADNLHPVDIGSANTLKSGAWVVAIGAAFGFDPSVAAGIVSDKGRHLPGKQYVSYIQTDVAVNPGNAGGPLLNTQGKVVGVNTLVRGRTGRYDGLSYAVPIGIAMDVAKQLKDDGTVERGWLGVQIQEVTLALAKSFNMDWAHGALVAHVVPGTPAAASSLKAGDVIIKYNGQPVPSVAALPPLVGMTTPGTTVEMVVVRNGEKHTLEVEIGKLGQSRWTGSWYSTSDGAGDSGQALGIRMRPLKDSERMQLGIPKGGVRILQVAPGPAREAGLEAGDVIAAAGSEPVSSPDALRKLLSNTDDPVALRVVRDGVVRYMVFQPAP